MAMRCVALFLVGLLASCGPAQVDVQKLASGAHMSRHMVKAGKFHLTAYARITAPKAPMVIYIEGDGRAWQSRYEPSQDPTPRRPIALALAALDPASNVVYLARPCQFTASDTACDSAYWTDKRFSPEVVASLNEAVDYFVAIGKPSAIHIVGYSGGGAVASLLAARRSDIASLRTIAGNLDTEALNRHHRVSPMPGSLNPIDSAGKLSQLPQIHFSGGKDDIVPPFIAKHFIDRQTAHHCIRHIVMPDATHSTGWEEAWKAEAYRIPSCEF